MCDIYMAKCEGCGAQIDMHIGGYSCKREAVTVWCPSCLKKAEPPKADSVQREEHKVLWDREGECWTAAWSWRINRQGRTIIVYVTDPTGREIHPN